MSVVVVEYCVVDVGLLCRSYLVIGLSVAFLCVDLIEVEGGIGGFMVIY